MEVQVLSRAPRNGGVRITILSLHEEVLLEGPGIEIPNPIDTEIFGLDSIAVITDSIGRSHDIFVFTPEDEMPTAIAEWLRYRSLTENVVSAEHELDKIRFRDEQEVVDNFLVDQNGRTLLVAVGTDNSRLYAATWLHRLNNDQNDHLLVKAATDRLEKMEFLNPEVSRISTFATREYGAAVRRSLDLKLGSLGVDKYFEQYDNDCLIVVGRYGGNDNFQIEISDASDSHEISHRFRPIDGGFGWTILGALNPTIEEVVDWL